MNKLKIIILVMAVVAAAFFAKGVLKKASYEVQQGAMQKLPETSIYNLQSTWLNQNGEEVNIAKLQGKFQVVAMAYTSCKFVCPRIIEDMKNIQKKLPSAYVDKVHFTLFSIDPEHDKPAVLKAFSQHRKLNEKSWTLLTSATDSNVRALAIALGVKYKKESDGTFSHSAMITLLNPQGNIQFQLEGIEQDPADLIKKIISL